MRRACNAVHHSLRSDPLRAIATSAESERLQGLTQREREVLACLAAGDNNRAIAQRLDLIHNQRMQGFRGGEQTAAEAGIRQIGVLPRIAVMIKAEQGAAQAAKGQRRIVPVVK